MDGSSAYLGTVNQGILSVYYYLLEKLEEAGFEYQTDSNGDPTNVKISWIDNEKQVVLREDLTDVDKEIPLPIITIEDTGGHKTAFELGNAAAGKSRVFVIMVRAENILQRNKYMDYIENIFSEREITIRDYNSGSPAILADNQNLPIFGISSTGIAFTNAYDTPSDPNVMDRHIGVISFTLEILQITV